MADKPRYLPPQSQPSNLAKLLKTKQDAEAERQHLVGAAIEWLEAKWGQQPCPYCGQIEWQVGTPLDIQLFPDETMSPSFPVMCGNCGHTTLVNAVLAGIADPPPQT